MPVTGLFPLEQGNHEEQHACADDGGDELPDLTAAFQADEAHEPPAEEATDDTDDNIDNQTVATAFHQLASQPAGQRADEQINNDTYNAVHNI